MYYAGYGRERIKNNTEKNQLCKSKKKQVYSQRVNNMIIKKLFVERIAPEEEPEDAPLMASFIASTSAEDRYGDVIAQSWDLTNYRKNPIILFNHDANQLPIGKGDVDVVDGNLMIDITFDMDDPRAAEIGRKVKAGFLNAVSVGFNPIEAVERSELPDGHFAKGEKGTFFKSAELLEVSVVTIPANQEAVSSKEYRNIENVESMTLSKDQAMELYKYIEQLRGSVKAHARQADFIESLFSMDDKYYGDDEDSESEEDKPKTKDVNYGLKSNAKEAMEALKESTQKALINKAEQHNEEYGDNPEKKLTNRNYLAVSYHRGLAAFFGNPSSVRPSVSSADQWAMARVNGLLFAMRTGKFKSKPYDVDLLPKDHPLSNAEEEKQITKEISNFPKAGEDKKVSLRNSQYPIFPVDYAEKIKLEYPSIWRKGGNILGNQQFRLLKKIQENSGVPETDNQEEAIRLREAWAARHLQDFRTAGTVAQMKWLVIGEKGLQHMKDTINAEIDKLKKLGSSPKDQEAKSFAFLYDLLKQTD